MHVLKNVKLVLFDCDGVLVDSEELSYKVYSEEFAREGFLKTAEELMELMSGFSLDDMINKVNSLKSIPLPKNFKKQLNKNVLARFSTDLKPVHAIADFLTTLQNQKKNICVVSNGELDRIDQALKSTSLDHFFKPEHRFNVNLVKRGKPAPDLFLYAAHYFNVNPIDCLVIEDSTKGIKAAQAASMPVIGFLGGTHAKNSVYQNKIKAMNPTKIAYSVKDLLALD